MSKLLDQRLILSAIEATWPPAKIMQMGPWILRDGQGGGKRVSAASLNAQGQFDLPDIERAEQAMRGLGQSPLFVIAQDRAGDAALDGALALRGYERVDPVVIYTALCAELSAPLPHTTAAYSHWPPLALAQDIWAQAGIGPARLAVMARSQGIKAAFLLRAGDHPVGVCFAALAGNLAMLHALEILPAQRRQGHGRSLICAVSAWAAAQGAESLALIVTAANTQARALYAHMGMIETGHFHYRIQA